MNPVSEVLPPLEVFRDPEMKLNLSYRRSGSTNGYPLVFLHGFNGSSRSWAYQFAHFTDRAQVVSIDFPGYGRSSAGEVTMEEVADRVSRLIGHLDLTPCVLVGHSMGGMLAQVLACNHGERVAGLVLSCTHKGYAMPVKAPLDVRYTSRIEERQALDDKAFGKLRIDKMLPGYDNAEIKGFLEEIAADIRVEAIRTGGGAMQSLDTSPLLHRLTQPCLIITAENDRIVTPERSQDLLQALPAARHVILKNVGHAPYSEDAAAFNKSVERFVGELPD